MAGNFIRGSGRLATDRFDFLAHYTGTDFRHLADQIDLDAPLPNLGNADDVQEALQFINDNFSGGGGGGVSYPINLSTLGNTTGILPIVRGGTGIGTIGASGTVATSNGTGFVWATIVNANIAAGAAIAVSKLAPGSNGQVLQVSAGIPIWASPPAGVPGGSSPQLQYNNGGIFDGTANATYTGGKVRLASNLQFIASAITGDLSWTPTSTNKTLTLPDATDTIVARATTDTLTNKTIVAASNTITDTSAVLGDILVHNGTRFVRQAQGTNGQFWGVSGGVAGYFTPAGGGGGSPGGSNTQFQYNNAGAFGGSTNVVYTGGKLQTAANLQYISTGITGDLAWAPTSTNKLLNLPDANDTLVGKATTDTLTNKTIDVAGTGNNLTSTSQAVGDLLKNNGSKFLRFARGSALQVLRVNAGGTDLEYATLSSGGSSAGLNGQVQLSDGAGGFLAALQTFGSSIDPFLSIGSPVSTTGNIRLQPNGTIYVKGSGINDQMIIGGDANDGVLLGNFVTTAFTLDKNNVFLRQKNAAGSSYYNLIYLDSSNAVSLGDSSIANFTFPNNKVLRQYNAATSSTYSLLYVNSSDVIRLDENDRGVVFGSGASPAVSGRMRIPYSASLDIIMQTKTSGGNERAIIQRAADTFEFSHTAYTTTYNGNTLLINANGDTLFYNGGTHSGSATSNNWQFARPRLGTTTPNPTPYASEGQATITVAAGTNVLTSAQYSRAIWKFVGNLASGGCTIQVPAPVGGADESYKKYYRYSSPSMGSLVFTTGGGHTFTAPNIAGAEGDNGGFIFVTPDGVYGKNFVGMAS